MSFNDINNDIFYHLLVLFDLFLFTNHHSYIMRLRPEVLKAINTPLIRRYLMDALACTEFTISRYIQKNSDNLTKAAALKVIREATGLTDEEILEVH